MFFRPAFRTSVAVFASSRAVFKHSEAVFAEQRHF